MSLTPTNKVSLPKEKKCKQKNNLCWTQMRTKVTFEATAAQGMHCNEVALCAVGCIIFCTCWAVCEDGK